MLVCHSSSARLSGRTSNSLRSGKITGNFRKFRPIPASWGGFGSRSPSGFNSLQPIPCSSGNREMFLPEQGIRPTEQGICRVERRRAEPHRADPQRFDAASPITGWQPSDIGDPWRLQSFNHVEACSDLSRLDRHGLRCHATRTPRPAFIARPRGRRCRRRLAPNHPAPEPFCDRNITNII